MIRAFLFSNNFSIILFVFLTTAPLLCGCLFDGGGSKSGSGEITDEQHQAMKKALSGDAISPFPEEMTPQFHINKGQYWCANYGNDQSLAELCKRKKRIKNLYLKSGNYTAQGLSLAKDKNVKKLLISSLNVNPRFIRTISQFDSLSELRFHGLSPSGDAIFTNLIGPKDLVLLEFRRADISGHGLAEVGAKLSKLTSLTITECENAFSESWFSSFLNLERLSVSNCPVNSKYLKEIGLLKKLQSLELAFSGLEDQDIKGFNTIKLKSLSIPGNNITDKGLQTISGIKTLSYLNIKECPKISKSALKKFKRKLKSCQVES